MNPLALFYMAQFEADKKEREDREKEENFFQAMVRRPLMERHML